MAFDFRRGKTSKSRLEIAWTFPVHKPAAAPEDGRTRAVEVERALPLEQCYTLIAEGDRRPLLVVRECDQCKGTDHALLSRTLDNEQTILLTHWFRCVKLPPNVLLDKHPLHNLFKVEPGARVPHLFFASADGSTRLALPGDQPQTELWDTMFGILEREYQGDAKKAVKELRGLLSQFDTLDAKELEIKARMDREIEKRGPSSPRLRKYQEDLEEVARDREQLIAREKELRDLALREPAGAKAATGDH